MSVITWQSISVKPKGSEQKRVLNKIIYTKKSNYNYKNPTKSIKKKAEKTWSEPCRNVRLGFFNSVPGSLANRFLQYTSLLLAVVNAT